MTNSEARKRIAEQAAERVPDLEPDVLDEWREEAFEYDDQWPADTRNPAAVQARRVLHLLAVMDTGGWAAAYNRAITMLVEERQLKDAVNGALKDMFEVNAEFRRQRDRARAESDRLLAVVDLHAAENAMLLEQRDEASRLLAALRAELDDVIAEVQTAVDEHTRPMLQDETFRVAAVPVHYVNEAINRRAGA